MKFFSLLIVGLVFSLSVQASDQSEVESVVDRYFESIQVYDTAIMSSMMHPEALKRFRTPILNALEGSKREQAKMELLPLFSVSNVEQYKSLTDVEAYKRLNDFVAKAQPQLIALMKSTDFEVVNIALKGDIAYVNYTLTMNIQDQSVEKDVVQKLKLHDGSWMLLLPPDGEATIAGIEARFK